MLGKCVYHIFVAACLLLGFVQGMFYVQSCALYNLAGPARDYVILRLIFHSYCAIGISKRCDSGHQSMGTVQLYGELQLYKICWLVHSRSSACYQKQ